MAKHAKEFPKDYEMLFQRVRNSFAGKGGKNEPDAGARAKVLLGRRVFQYFVNDVADEPPFRVSEVDETLSHYEYALGDDGTAGESAVTPETFAKAFEGLGGRVGRKSGGVFYTPEAVARHMCRESLKYYLAAGAGAENAVEADRRLAAVKVCDPAVGGGAFLAGMLEEIANARADLSRLMAEKRGRFVRGFKSRAAMRSLYGIDIDPAAAEMSKLRMRLAILAAEKGRGRVTEKPDFSLNILCGNALFGSGAMPSGAAGFEYKSFFPVVAAQNGGFDIVIGNPPYGAHMDGEAGLYAALYPDSTRHYKDVFKMFIDLAMSRLLKPGGILCFIVPNAMLLQPRYRDVRRLLLKHEILEIIDLGGSVFEDAVVPTGIVFARRDGKPGDVRFRGKSETAVKQKNWNSSPECMFIIGERKAIKDTLPLGEIMELKDGGIKYQRVKVGLAQKGGNDLAERLFYEGRSENSRDIPFFKGKDLNRRGWIVDTTQLRYFRQNYKKLLRENEKVYFSRELFEAPEKLVWRQTSSFFAGAYIESRMWFANTVQGGFLKDEYQEEFDLKYILALLNSNYLRDLYAQTVRETGRVFPQVKLSKLRNLPIKRIARARQKPFAEIVEMIERAGVDGKMDIYEKRLNEMVFELYGATEEEIIKCIKENF